MTKEKSKIVYSRRELYKRHQEIIEQVKQNLEAEGHSILYVQLKESSILDISKITEKTLGEFTSKIYYKEIEK